MALNSWEQRAYAIAEDAVGPMLTACPECRGCGLVVSRNFTGSNSRLTKLARRVPIELALRVALCTRCHGSGRA